MPSAIDPILVEEHSKPQKALSSFNRLSSKVRLYTPSPGPTVDPSSTHPTTILLCAWLNAAPKHIEYYTKQYNKRYPSARIILVTITTNDFLFQTETRRRSDVSSAVSALLAPAHEGDGEDERLFVHSLSNGGAKRVYGVAGAYAAQTGRPLPVKAWLFDSGPGIPQFRRDIYALEHAARKWSWAAWLPYMAVVVSVTTVVYVVVNWLPKWVWRELVWGPTDGVNEHRLVAPSCVKGFIYSQADKAIDYRDVERHVAETREKGYRVETKLVHGAEHVQQFRGKEGEVGYWGFVEKIMEMGMSR